MEQQELLDQQDPQDKMELLDQQDPQDKMELLVLLELLDHKVLRELLGQRELLGLQDRKDS
jgi:hypothetical protein